MNTAAALLAPAPRSLLFALLVATVPYAWTGDAARAQNVDLSTDDVTVDLSVINDMGRPAPAGAASVSPSLTPPGGGLLVPGPRNPTSQLHVTVPPGPGEKRVQLRPPSAKPKKTAAAAPSKPAPAKPKPAPKKPTATEKPAAPQKTAAASQPPAPLTAPPSAPAMPAAPAAKGAPPPPPAVVEPEKKPAPPAKTAAATAPAASAPAKTEQASASPAGAAIKEGRALQVAFAAGVAKLPNEAKDGLSALAKKLKDDDSKRLQLLAYAGGKDLSPSKARRLSLSRALSVRSFLIESGIRSTRIDVRALGDKTTEEPVNRVDVNIVER